MGDVTQILGAIERGEPHAAEVLGVSRWTADQDWAFAGRGFSVRSKARKDPKWRLFPANGA